jgi:hypothetical protein
MNSQAHEEKEGRAPDKSQGDLIDGGKQESPEGLKRDRKGPLDKNVGDHKDRSKYPVRSDG